MVTYLVSGNTYPHKTAIHEAGGKWDAARKVWTIEIRERGMKRNDGLIYQLRKLSGVRVDREDNALAPAVPTEPPSARGPSAPSTRRSPRTARAAGRTAPPAGPQLRNDRAPYTEGDFIVAILRDDEISECAQRQGHAATEVPAVTDAAKPLSPGSRRVGCVVIYTDRISQVAADDNGYCGRYGAIVRLATAEECAAVIARRRKTASFAVCANYLEKVLQFDAPGVTVVSDTGKLPLVTDREALRDGAGDTTVLIVGRKTGTSGAVIDGGTHYALTATTVVAHHGGYYDDYRSATRTVAAHHGGYYDDYRSATRTVARTELLADVLRAVARDDADAMLVYADRLLEAGGSS